MSAAVPITDHDEIRQWAEERGGRPSRVKGRNQGAGGLLRIDFREPNASLEEISWEEFFEQFEESQLALLRQEETADGKISRFNKLVARD